MTTTADCSISPHHPSPAHSLRYSLLLSRYASETPQASFARNVPPYRPPFLQPSSLPPPLEYIFHGPVEIPARIPFRASRITFKLGTSCSLL